MAGASVLATLIGITDADRFSHGYLLVWWLIRATIIGPCEGIVNAESMATAGGPISAWTALPFAILCLAMMAAYPYRQNRFMAAISITGTTLWVLIGWGAALAWI